MRTPPGERTRPNPWETTMTDWDDNLDPEQREAVLNKARVAMGLPVRTPKPVPA